MHSEGLMAGIREEEPASGAGWALLVCCQFWNKGSIWGKSRDYNAHSVLMEYTWQLNIVST